MTRQSVVLTVALVALASVHLSAADDADVRMEMSRWLAGPYDAADKCHYVCQGDEMSGGGKPTINSLADIPEKYTCWGYFKVWCGSPPSGGETKAEKLSGSACQGHFKSMTFSPTAHPDKKVVYVSCEGGHAWISRRTATCPHTGKRWKKMMGTMGAGESSSGMIFPKDPDSGTTFASLVPLDNVKDPKEDSTLVSGLRGDEDLSSITSSLMEAVKAARLTPGNGTFGLESHASGMSVDWKATREVPPDSTDDTPEDLALDSLAAWDSLEEDANIVLGSSWLDWLPHFSGSSEGRREGDVERPTVLCNGKPAWAHGAFPCIGNFSVSGTRSSSSASCGDSTSKAQSGKDTMPRVLKALDTAKLILPGQTLPMVKDAPAWSQSMHAECDGFWGGLLRHCWGVATSHVVVERHGAFQLGMRSICSGRSGIKFIDHNGARGMASSCKGRHVKGLLAVIPKHAPTTARAALD